MGRVFVTMVSWVLLVTCAPMRGNSDLDATKVSYLFRGIYEFQYLCPNICFFISFCIS